MKITVLNKADIQKVFTMSEAIQAAKDALELYSKGQTNIPLRASLNVPEHNGNCLYMYGYVAPASAQGVKIVSIYPDNPKVGLPSVPATMVLLDSATGQVCSLLDGTHLTRFRTGAVSGAATELLSRKDSSLFGLIGAGGQAECQLEAVLTARPIKEVRVYCRSRDRREAFAKEMQDKYGEKFGVKIYAVDSANDAVIDADIVTAVTTATEALFDGNLLKKGCHVNGVGSYTPEMIELDLTTLKRAGKIYFDTFDGVLSEAGDFLQPMARGEFSKEEITGELGQLVAGMTPGRETDEEITVFKTVGSAVLDIVTAQRIYECAVKLGMGNVIEL